MYLSVDGIDVNVEKKLGIKTFIFKMFTGTILGFVVILFGLFFPNLMKDIGQFSDMNSSSQFQELISRYGNALMAIILFAGILIIVIGIATTIIRYISTAYTVGEYAIKFKKGLIARHEISIPYKGIQDVNLDQSIMYRVFGLSRLIILSAATDNKEDKSKARQVFDLIDIELAKHLREFLLKRSNIQEVKEI